MNSKRKTSNAERDTNTQGYKTKIQKKILIEKKIATNPSSPALQAMFKRRSRAPPFSGPGGAIFAVQEYYLQRSTSASYHHFKHCTAAQRPKAFERWFESRGGLKIRNFMILVFWLPGLVSYGELPCGLAPSILKIWSSRFAQTIRCEILQTRVSSIFETI